MTTDEERKRETKENAARSTQQWILIGAGVVVLVFAVAIAKELGFLQTDEEKCVDRGVEFFKGIGSYPTLTDGRRAEAVAKERCARTTGAFPEPR